MTSERDIELKKRMDQIERSIPLATSVEEVMQIWRQAEILCHEVALENLQNSK
jgi:hypothetical protein